MANAAVKLLQEVSGVTVPPPTRGPLGGNLNNPAQQPEARRAPHTALEGLDIPLHNPRGEVATCGLQHEQPWHRMAAYMLINGHTNKEIAAAAGVQPTTVSILRANRWFQELVAVLANEAGRDLTMIVQSEALASMETVVAIRDDANLPARTRLSAATFLFEQAHGKAVQKIVSSNINHTSNLTPQEEMAQIREELELLRKRNP